MLIEFHRRMLADEVRSAAFESALRRVIVPGSTTLADIGSGTGVLGFMARRLGAREVHLIEHGAVMELAERIAADNRLDGIQVWQAHSSEVLDPPRVDVVVAEVLGNLALEEDALETLADARRFLKPGGTLIPRRLEQFVAPVVADRLWRELASWDRAPLGLDFGAARAMSFDNVYVREIAPADLLPDEAPGRMWDEIEFGAGPAGVRHGVVRWDVARPATVYGFALWWHCELVPGIGLGTSPFGPATHWGQVYAPLAEPIAALAGDALALAFETETGGGEAGIAMRWEASHSRGDRVLGRRQHDLARGFIG
jgi:protein arginine N-methyltransferase 1